MIVLAEPWDNRPVAVVAIITTITSAAMTVVVVDVVSLLLPLHRGIMEDRREQPQCLVDLLITNTASTPSYHYESLGVWRLPSDNSVMVIGIGSMGPCVGKRQAS